MGKAKPIIADFVPNARTVEMTVRKASNGSGWLSIYERLSPNHTRCLAMVTHKGKLRALAHRILRAIGDE